MDILEVILLIVGIVIFIGSFLLPAGRSDAGRIDTDAAKQEIHGLIEEEMKTVRAQVQDKVEETSEDVVEKAILSFVTHYGLLGLMTALPTTPSFMDYEAVYLPKNHFIKEESMATEDYLALFYPFDKLDVVKKGVESSWNVSGDNMMIALTMTFMDEPMAKNMSFQREYAEPYDWVAQQFKDWAFTLTTSILYYNDYDSIDEDTRNLYRKAMAAFGGIAPTYHIELLEKPTIYWDFHSLLLGIQMMFSFMLVDDAKPLRLCKHCQKVFLGSRANSAFCSARCKNQYNVYKSRGKNKGQDGENDD